MMIDIKRHFKFELNNHYVRGVNKAAQAPRIPRLLGLPRA